MPKRTPLEEPVEDLAPAVVELEITEELKTRWVELATNGMSPAAAAIEIGIPLAELVKLKEDDPLVKETLEISVLSTMHSTRMKKRIVRQGSYSHKARMLGAILDDSGYMGYQAKYVEMANPELGKEGSPERARAEERFEFVARYLVASMMPKESATRVINVTPDTTPPSLIEIEAELVELEVETKTIHARIAHAGRTRRESAARLAGGSGADPAPDARLEEGETGVAEVG